MSLSPLPPRTARADCAFTRECLAALTTDLRDGADLSGPPASLRLSIPKLDQEARRCLRLVLVRDGSGCRGSRVVRWSRRVGKHERPKSSSAHERRAAEKKGKPLGVAARRCYCQIHCGGMTSPPSGLAPGAS